ncbi:MAG: sodium:proton antiporter, partial [Paludibacteraceae bacterium]|nr:sodium:proton antiporter [Paludibacteraceae bacterium]
MVTLMIILFLTGYACIALEHNLKINKAATALLLSSLLWTIYIFYAQSFLPNEDEFIQFNAGSPDIFHNIIRYVTEVQIIEHIGDVAEIIFFLLGAMTIVELID